MEVATLKGLYGGHETIAGIGSLIIHVAAVALLLVVGSLPPVQKAVKEFVPFVRAGSEAASAQTRAVQGRRRKPAERRRKPRASFPRWRPSRLFRRFARRTIRNWR